MTYIKEKLLTPSEARKLQSLGFIVKRQPIMSKDKDLYKIWVI